MGTPFYKDDWKPAIKLSKFQLKNIEIVKDKISNWKYILVKNNCLCNNVKEKNDIIISKKDRYGLNISQVLCSKCWLIRSWVVFDEKSNMEFYKNEYRSIYVWAEIPPKEFFDRQKERWLVFKDLFKKYGKYSTNMNIFEIWCWAGGILLSRKEEWSICWWCDFNEKYLDYGIHKWLNLKYWDYDKLLEEESIDVIIVSHVMEHFLTPIRDIQKIVSKIKKWWYLIVEVPWIFTIHEMYFDPLLYLQNAHVFNYYKQYLNIFFKQLWLKIIYWDERCTFILQKPDEYKIWKIHHIYDTSLGIYPNKILQYLIKCKKNIYFNPFFWADKILKPLWLYNLIKKIYFILKTKVWK